MEAKDLKQGLAPTKKKGVPIHRDALFVFQPELLGGFGLAVAIAAINRAIAAGLERDFSLFPTCSTNRGIHLAPGTGAVTRVTTDALRFSGLPARGAAFRFVGVTARGE